MAPPEVESPARARLWPLYDLTALALGAAMYGIAWIVPFTHGPLVELGSGASWIAFATTCAPMMAGAWTTARLFRRPIVEARGPLRWLVAFAATECGAILFLWMFLALESVRQGDLPRADSFFLVLPAAAWLASWYGWIFTPAGYGCMNALRAVARRCVARA